MYQVLLFKFRRHLCKGSMDQESQARALAGVILGPCAKHFTLTVPPCTQVYKWVTEYLMFGIILLY